MPKSKRATVVHLTKTKKKTKESKVALIEDLRSACEKYAYIWLFEVEHMRNVYLQEIRAGWKPGRIFLGRNSVMRVAFGQTPETEHRRGLAHLASILEGDTGLLCTDEEPKVVMEWFDDYVRDDHARKGNIATETVTLPAGPVMIQQVNDSPAPAPHSLDTHLRALLLPSTLQKGVPTLSDPYTVCKEGEKLDTKQAGLLKVLGWRMAKFKVRVRSVWVRDEGFVKDREEVEGSVWTADRR